MSDGGVFDADLPEMAHANDGRTTPAVASLVAGAVLKALGHG